MEDVMAQRYKQSAVGLAFAAARLGKTAEVGQALLEFALLLPVLCLLSIGVVEIGRAAYMSIVVTDAATAGVEYGSQNVITASQTTEALYPPPQQSMQSAAICDADSGAGGVSCNSSILNTSNVTATYGCYCDTGNGASCTYVPGGQDCTGSNSSTCSCGTIPANCSSGSDQIVECVQVDTTYTFNSLFNWPGLLGPYYANGHSVMRVRQ